MKQEVAASETSVAGNSCGVCPFNRATEFQDICEDVSRVLRKIVPKMLMRRKFPFLLRERKKRSERC